MSDLRVNGARLLDRLSRLGQVGALEGGGVCRLALTDADKAGRDLVVAWMKSLGLEITIDRIGNVVGLRRGAVEGPPVMTGSHIDTVATGGLYDGNLGVLAGLEIVEALNDAGVRTRHPIAVAFFTNEEGARFAPDMMGSGVHQGQLALDDCLAARGIDGTTVGAELQRIGYAGDSPVGSFQARAFVELHIEQGPVLEQEGVEIGVVTGVQGISWTEYEVAGTSNHAGTTPMHLRHDAGYAAAAIAVGARAVARDMGGNQIGTAGLLELEPSLVNVIARWGKVTVDLRNTDETALQEAERRMASLVAGLEKEEGLTITSRGLARFQPVQFEPAMVERVAAIAEGLGHNVRRMPSGAGHDAQMFAPNCPTAMIFVPSKGGISHNVREHTAPQDVANGANVLLQVLLSIASE